MMPTLPRINRGTRTIISGRTGSGKTTLAAYLMRSRSKQSWIILNPKHTAGYKSLANSAILNGWNGKELERRLRDSRFVIIDFKASETKPEFMDDVISYVHDSYDNIGICCDELYYLHTNGRAGDGLVGLLTRGRERNQSFLGLTQRPAWISRFCFSEADNIVGMALNLEADRRRMLECTGNEGFLSSLAKRHWLWYNVDADSAQLWGPVPIK